MDFKTCHRASKNGNSFIFKPCRRDKYEHNLKEYWIDVETTGSFENENEESLVDTTHGSGDAVDFDLGLPAPDPNAGSRSPGEDPAADETDQDISDDDEDGDARSARSRKVPDKEGVEREAALEDGVVKDFY